MIGFFLLISNMKTHNYTLNLEWKGNKGEGTKSYEGYDRDHIIWLPEKPLLNLSSDPYFRGDKSKYNPEELFLYSLASCHMLWYLHLCAKNNIIVEEYRDTPKGIMVQDEKGVGKFTEVTLFPEVLISDGDVLLANDLHEDAHDYCFIANSCNFPIDHEPTIRI